MTSLERGILLLCCALGQENVQPLTMAQLRDLSQKVHANSDRDDPMRDVTVQDLLELDYCRPEAERIVSLLEREDVLDRYEKAMQNHRLKAITRISPAYPPIVSERLGLSAPPVLFCAGDETLLQKPCISLVGSRKLRELGKKFAEQTGELAAERGLVLCSGGAEGADRTAQEACLANGGCVIVFTPKRLLDYHPLKRLLVVSEGGCELGFSTQRAMGRNRLIHAMGEKTFVAQCAYGSGGTWHGTVQNLKHQVSPVAVCADGSEAMLRLCHLGATAVRNPAEFL